MKSKINIIVLIITCLGFLVTACNKSEDLLTKDVKTGGLVKPTGSVPYKLGATPTVSISVDIPMGPAITSIKVLNKYYGLAAGQVSNEVLMKTISVDNGNSTGSIISNYSITYADLTKDLVIGGKPLPSDETLLPIGDNWKLSYISVMQDGREVLNNSTTIISVANIYAGSYQCVGIFHHPTAGDRPINEEKFLTPLSAYSCSTSVGDLASSGYSMTITVDPVTNDVSFSNGVPAEILPSVERSYFEPSTGKFYLHYFYVGGSGKRIMDEVYTPK